MYKKSIFSAFLGIFAAAQLHSTGSAAVLLADHYEQAQCGCVQCDGTHGHGSHDHGHHHDGFHSVTYTGTNPQAFGVFSAATVTNNEAALDAIFSQASFGATTVDIRFNAIKTLINTPYLDIATDAELINLLNDPIGDAIPTVNMFYIDTVDSCGGFNPAIVGCAFTPGNSLVVESSVAAGVSGPELQAHELGHNLNLNHDTSGTPNLMTGSINGNTDLTAAQVATILASPLIQIDGGTGQRFIEINPILVQAAAVPEPAAATFLGFAGFLLIGRRKR